MSVCILMLAMVGSFLWISRDESPPDDKDLRLERPNIPKQDNGFYHLNFSIGDVCLSEPNDARTICKMVDGEVWDEDLYIKATKKNEEVLELYRKAMNCEYFRVEAPYHLELFPDYLLQWHSLECLFVLRARHHFRNGREMKAFEAALDLARFGQKVQNAGGGFDTYFSGSRKKDKARQLIQEFLKRTTLDSEILRGHGQELRRYRFETQAYVEMLKADYMLWCAIFDALAGEGLPATGGDGKEYVERHRWGYSFKPNQTKKLVARLYRVAIENVDKIYAERTDIDSLPFIPRHNDIKWFTVNRKGKGWAEDTRLALNISDRMVFKQRISWLATELLVALKCYQIDNRRLPDSLEKLAPEYIDEIPRDPFDGKPLRYSKEKRIIYSVGDDLKDSGGPSQEQIDRGWAWRLLEATDPAVVVDL